MDSYLCLVLACVGYLDECLVNPQCTNLHSSMEVDDDCDLFHLKPCFPCCPYDDCLEGHFDNKHLWGYNC